MTQPPHAGPSAPTSTGNQWNGGSTSWSAPANDAPAARSGRSATPWGSTSSSNPPGQSATGASSRTAPNTAAPDAPTGSVPPLVQGTRAPANGPAPAAPTRHADASGTSARSRGRSTRGPRRARLQLRHVDPWTVLKFACVLSIALFFVWLIVIGVLYGVLDGAGVINKINDAVTSIGENGAKPPIRAGIVFGGAAIIGVVNMVLFIALSTIGSVVYNLCADLVGGVEVTLSER